MWSILTPVVNALIALLIYAWKNLGGHKLGEIPPRFQLATAAARLPFEIDTLGRI